MHLHIRGDRPFSLTNKFNYAKIADAECNLGHPEVSNKTKRLLDFDVVDIVAWRTVLCLTSILTLGVANHVVQTARYFQMQDRQGIVDDSPYRDIYDFVRGVLEGKDDVDAGRVDDGQRESWKFISPRLRILYGDNFGRVREC